MDEFTNWLAGPNSFLNWFAGPESLLGQIGKSLFPGVEPRNPIAETTQFGGFGNFTPTVNPNDPNSSFLESVISEGNSFLTPLIQDYITRENYLNPIRSSVGDIESDASSAYDLIREGAELKGVVPEYIKGLFGANLRDAITAGRESFDPSLNPSVLASSEAGTRESFTANLGGVLSNLATSYSNQLNPMLQTRTGINQFLASLAPGLIGSQILSTSAAGTDADISNSRFEELAMAGDIGNFATFLQGQIDRGTQMAGGLLSSLFPGTFGGGGGSDKSKNSDYGAMGGLGGTFLGTGLGALLAAPSGGVSVLGGASLGGALGGSGGGFLGSLFD